MKNKTKFEKFTDILYWVVRAISACIIVFAIVWMAIDFRESQRAETKYMFMMLQAIAMIALSILPWLAKKLWKVELPVLIELFFLLFFVGGIFFGEIFEFYVRFSWWDDLLHAFSGGFMAALGFTIVNAINESDKFPVKLSPGFVAFFAFCFAMTCESIWEIFEFTADSIFGSNMQRYHADHGDMADFVGREALMDTMSDIIEVLIGSLVMVYVGYFDIKLNKKIVAKNLTPREVSKEELEAQREHKLLKIENKKNKKKKDDKEKEVNEDELRSDKEV